MEQLHLKTKSNTVELQKWEDVFEGASFQTGGDGWEEIVEDAGRKGAGSLHVLVNHFSANSGVFFAATR